MMKAEVKQALLKQTFQASQHFGELGCSIESLEAINAQVGWMREDLYKALQSEVEAVIFVQEYRTHLTLMADLFPRLLDDTKASSNSLETIMNNITEALRAE